MKIKSTKLISMLLVVCMLFSFSSVAFAAVADSGSSSVNSADVDGDGVVKYVSLGESMTNGYGNPGYYPGYPVDEEGNPTKGYEPANIIDRMYIHDYAASDGAWAGIWNGSLNVHPFYFTLDGMADVFNLGAPGTTNTFGYGRTEPTTYASIFADYLDGTLDGTVNESVVKWEPWAMSGQRPEDFYWLMQEQWQTNYEAGTYLDAGKDGSSEFIKEYLQSDPDCPESYRYYDADGYLHFTRDYEKDKVKYRQEWVTTSFQTLFEEDGTYNGDMYTTEIWKNGNDNEGKASRFLAAKYGRFSADIIGWISPGYTGLGSDIQYTFDGAGNPIETAPEWVYSAPYGNATRTYRNSNQAAEDALAEFREEYQTAITEADVISVNLGTHSFSSVVTSRLLGMLTTGGVDWFNDGRSTAEQLLTFFPEYKYIYDSIKSIIDSYVGAEVAAVIGEEKYEAVVDLYGYATLSFLITYDRSLEIIRDLNPKAQIIVLGMTNFQEGLKFDMGNGKVIDFGALFGTLVDFTNLYRAGWVADSRSSTFVAPVDDMDLLIDEFGRNDTNVVYLTKIIGSMSQGWDFNSPEINGLLSGKAAFQRKVIEYIHKDGNVTDYSDEEIAGCEKVLKMYRALQEIAKDEYFDGAAALEMFGEGGSIDMASATARLESDGIDALTETEKISIHLWIRCFMGEGIGCHPSVEGHKDLAKKLIACYEEGFTGEDYVEEEVPAAFTVEKIYDYLDSKSYISDDQVSNIIEFIGDYLVGGTLDDAATFEIAKFLGFEIYDKLPNDEARIEVIETIYNILDEDNYINSEIKMIAGVVSNLYGELTALEFLDDAKTVSIIDFVCACYEDQNLSDTDVNNILRFAYYTLTGNVSFNPMMSRTVGTLDDDQKILLIQTIVDVLEESNPEAVAQVAPTLAVYYELEDKGLVTSGDAVEVFEYLFNGATTSDPELKFDLTDETVLQDVAETVVNMVLEDKPADVKIQIMATVAGTLGGSVSGGTEMPEIPSIDDLPAEVKEIYNYLSANGYITEEQKNAVIDYALDIAFGNVTLPADKKELVIVLSEKLYEIFMMNPNLTAEDILDIAEFIAGVYEEEIVTTLKDAYAKAYAKAVEAGLIAAAQNGLDDAIFAFESAIATIEAYYEENKDEVPSELAETVANLKAAAITELEACIETATALKSILDNDTLTRAMLVEIYNLKDQLALHCQNAVDFARQTNADLTPFVNAGVDKVLEQVKVLSDIAADAYDMLSVVPEEYVKFCEQVTAYAEAIDPRLAAAVAKFLAETPADAMEILYAYGEEAVTKLVTDAVAAYGDIYEAAVLFLDTIVKYGLDMHETLKTNPELQQLLDIISENLKTAKAIAHGALDGDIFDLAMQYKDLTKEQIYQLVYGEIMLAYNTAYPLVLSALHAIHPQAEASVRLAYNTFVNILTTSYNFADGYLSWLEERTDILDADLFASIMGNVTELLETVHEILEELGYEATHAEYCICGGEHDYVALGGNLTVAPSYAEIFAEALAAAGADATVNAKNLAYDADANNGVVLTAKNLVDYIKSNAAEIAEAEFITFNMDATDTIAIMMEALEGNFVDWSEYVDFDAMANVDWTAGMSEKQAKIAKDLAAQITDEVKTTIEEEFDTETIKAVAPYVEILVYAAVSYGIETYEALETIAAINPDALIAVVGMVNPFEGTTVVFDGNEINIGEIFDYAIEATDLFNKYYAILTGNVTFVSVAGAETIGALAPTEIVIPADMNNMSMSEMAALADAFVAVLEGAYLTADGHAEVCEALLEAIALDGEHNYGDWIVVSVADIGVEGYKYRVCSDCGHKDEVTEPAKLPTIIPLVPFEPSVGGNEFVHFHCDGGANCHCRDFEDLDNTMWYHQGVCYMIDKGHMIGIGDNKWGPEQVITRAEIATILWRIAGSEVVDYALDFSDVEADMWYTEAIEWAVSEEIFLGYGDGTFGPNDQITREQMVTVMYRFELDNGKKVTADFDMATLSDAEEISEWAVEAMTWAFDCGLILGTDADVLTASPLKTATRAEVAMIFYRKLDRLLK